GDDRRRLAAAALPPGLSAVDDALAGRRRHLRALAGVERIPLRLPAAVEGHRDHLAGGAGQFPLGRRFAVGIADDRRPDLLAAAGGDLLYLQALHVLGPDRGGSQGLDEAEEL